MQVATTFLLFILASSTARAWDSVTTDKSSYDVGDNIVVSFTDAWPSFDGKDWIAITNAHIDLNTVSADPPLWLRTCGTQSCSSPSFRGKVTFGYEGPNSNGGTSFPLPAGSYVASLIRYNYKPYKILAKCTSFTIVDKKQQNPLPSPPAQYLPTCDTVEQKLGNSGNFGKLLSAAQKTNLLDHIPDHYTLFAPNDDAWDKLGDLNTISTLKSILLYHVVPSKILSSTLKQGNQYITTLNGKDIFVNIRSGYTVYINDSPILNADLLTCGGVIHEIGLVLQLATPPKPALPSVPTCQTTDDLLRDSNNLQKFRSALLKTNLLAKLPHDFTIFAPNNDAWNKLGIDLGALWDDVDALEAILLYHVVSTKILSSSLREREGYITTRLGEDIFVSVQSGYVIYVNYEAQIVNADLVTCRGVIHEINMVLQIPPEPTPRPTPRPTPQPVQIPTCQSAELVLKHSLYFNKLLSALTKTGFLSELYGDFTLFAPTDSAWHKLDVDLDDLWNDPHVLADIIAFHVVRPGIWSNGFHTDYYPTLLGKDIYVEVKYGKIVINSVANVIGADKVACNGGVIHFIDTVLQPPYDTIGPPPNQPPPKCQTIVEVLEHAGNFDKLISALKKTNLVDLLSSGPYTLFAPNDNAWRKFGKFLDQLWDDPYSLEIITKYHVLPGEFWSSDLVPGYYKTLQGQEVYVKRFSHQGHIFVNSAQLLTPDIETCYQLSIHEISSVLLPPAVNGGGGGGGGGGGKGGKSGKGKGGKGQRNW